MKLYNPDGTILADVPVGKGSTMKRTLMGEDSITLKFSLETPISIPLGCYCDERLTNNERYIITSLYVPKYNTRTGGYDYDVVLNKHYFEWKNITCKYMPQTAPQESKWSLTDNALTHINQILKNINAYQKWQHSTTIIYTLSKHVKVGDTAYNNVEMTSEYDIVEEVGEGTITLPGNEFSLVETFGNDGDFFYPQGLPFRRYVNPTENPELFKAFDENRYLSYDNINIFDALTQLANAYGCEWWVEDNIVYLGDCEREEETEVFSLETNLTDLTRQQSKNEYATRYFAFGGTRNIPNGYRGFLVFNTKYLRIMPVTQWGGGSYPVFQDENNKEILPNYFDTSYEEYTTEAIITNWDSKPIGERLLRQLDEIELPLGKYRPSSTSSPAWLCIDISFQGETTTSIAATYHVILSYGDPNSDNYRVLKEFSAHTEIQGGIKIRIDSSEFTNETINAETPDNLHLQIWFDDIAPTTATNIRYTPKFGDDDHPDDIYWKFLKEKYDSSTVGIRFYNTIDEAIADEGEDTYRGIIGYQDNLNREIVVNCAPNIVQEHNYFVVENVKRALIPASWFIYSAQELSGGLSERRLKLPISQVTYAGLTYNGDGYFDKVEGGKIIEKTVIFDDIYPRENIVVAEIDNSETYIDDYGQKKPYFKIKAKYIEQQGSHEVGDWFSFSSDDILVANTLTVIFKSGRLNGMEFEVGFENKVVDGIRISIFTLVPNETYGVQLPDGNLIPQVGDELVITGFDIDEVIGTGMVENAEVELAKRFLDYVSKQTIDSTFEGTYDSDLAYQKKLSGAKGYIFPIGQKAQIINDAMIEGGVFNSRVIGYEVALDLPYDNPKYTFGLSASYSRLEAIESKIANR